MTRFNVNELLARFSDGHRYRPIRREDIVAGATMFTYLVPVRSPIHDLSASLGEIGHVRNEITIDPQPFNDEGTHVCYHQTMPFWDGQCFVPLEAMIGVERQTEPGPYWLTLFLVSAKAAA